MPDVSLSSLWTIPALGILFSSGYLNNSPFAKVPLLQPDPGWITNLLGLLIIKKFSSSWITSKSIFSGSHWIIFSNTGFKLISSSVVTISFGDAI